MACYTPSLNNNVEPLQETLYKALEKGNYETVLKIFKESPEVFALGQTKAQSYLQLEYTPFLQLLKLLIEDFDLHYYFEKHKEALETDVSSVISQLTEEARNTFSLTDKLIGKLKILNFFLEEVSSEHPAFLKKGILHILIDNGYNFKINLWLLKIMLSGKKAELLKAEVNTTDSGSTLLQLAFKRMSIELFDHLLYLGARLSLKDKECNTVIHNLLKTWCIGKEDKLKFFKQLLKVGNKDDVEKALVSKNNEDETIMHLLVKMGDVEALKLVSSILGVKVFAEILAFKTKNKSSVLHLATEIKCDQDALLMYEYLFTVRTDWDINEPDLYGVNCWKKIINNSVYSDDSSVTLQKNTLQFLMSKGALISSKDKGNRTDLHNGVIYGKIDLVEFLLELKADPNAMDNEGLTPLDYTKPEIAEILSSSLSGFVTNLRKVREENHPQIAKLLIAAGAKDVDIPKCPVPEVDHKLLAEYEMEKKLRLEQAPELSNSCYESLARDEKTIQALFEGLQYETFLCRNQEEIKSIKESYPNAYYFTEPMSKYSTATYAVLYTNLNEEQERCLKEANKIIEEYQKSTPTITYFDKIDNQPSFVNDKNKFYNKEILRNNCATEQECKNAIETHGIENVLLGFDGGSGFRELRVYKDFKGLSGIQKEFFAELKSNIKKYEDLIHQALQNVQKTCKNASSRIFKLRSSSEKENLMAKFKPKKPHVWLMGPEFSDELMSFTIYQKLSATQQKTLNAIQVNTKSVILKNRLGFDLMHFKMSRHLKHLGSKHAAENTRLCLDKLRAKMIQLKSQKKKHTPENIAENIAEIRELQIDIFLIEQHLRDLDRFFEITGKHSGKSQFDQYLLKKSQKPKFVQTIGKHTLEFLDLRNEDEDYLWFTNAITTWPSSIEQLVSGDPKFLEFAGYISTCLVNKSTRGFIGTHHGNTLFSINMVLSVPAELIAYLADIDIGSPYACDMTAKIKYLNSLTSKRIIMDIRQAMYQLIALEKDPTRFIPDCPYAVQKALRMDPCFKESSYRDSGSLPLYTPEGLIRDTYSENTKSVSFYESSYNEAIIKTNTFCSSNFKIEGKLLIVEKHLLDAHVNNLHGKLLPEYAKSADESLSMLANIHNTTKGRLQLALVETDLNANIAKMPPEKQVSVLIYEITNLVRDIWLLNLKIKRHEMNGIDLPIKFRAELVEDKAKYQYFCEMYSSLMAPLQKPPRVMTRRSEETHSIDDRIDAQQNKSTQQNKETQTSSVLNNDTNLSELFFSDTWKQDPQSKKWRQNISLALNLALNEVTQDQSSINMMKSLKKKPVRI